VATSYSKSKIETFGTCPRQYKFQYIEKAAVKKPVSVEAFLGDAVHRALERLYSFKLNLRVQPPGEMLEFYNKYWEGPDRDRIKVTRENLGVDDYIRVGAEALTKFYEQYVPFEDGVSLALEKNISFPLDPEERFVIRGKIDRLCRRPDGIVEIIDYKTNSSLPAQRSLEDDTQMGLYQLGVKYLWPDFDRIELKQIFLRHGVSLSAVMDDDKLEEISYRTFQRILEIENARREDNFPPHESAICNWCVYFELCPAKRHRLALDDDIPVEFDKSMGKEMAEKYLNLSREKKLLDSQLDALKQDIISFCAAVDITRLEGSGGHIKLSVSESETFPTKSDDENAYYEISALVREAGIEECFKLDQNILYKEFFVREKLPPALKERLQAFLRRKRQAIVRASYEKEE